MFYRIVIAGFSFLMVVVLQACETSSKRSMEAINFTDDVAPLIHRNCTKCHQNGEAGPFNLVTYQDVASKAKLISHVITNRIMPPWPADPTYRHFANETYLNDTEIALIQQWISEGLKPGDTTKVVYHGGGGNGLVNRKPDMILRVPQFPLPGNNTDLFAVVKIPFELPQDTFIEAVEFVCKNKRLVHHVNAHLINFVFDKKKNVSDGLGWINQDQSKSTKIHRDLGLLHDDGSYPAMTPSVSNYLPGSLFTAYPKGIGGYHVKRKAALYLNDIHYGPTPIDSKDSSYFKIYFGAKAPKRPVFEFQMGTLGIAPVVPELIVEAGEVKKFTIDAVLPEDISVLTIVPHMHLIGKSYLAYAIKPNGDTVPLIRIPRWDFRWQYFYQLEKPLRLPRGTKIHVEGIYDNTIDNPNNPFNPPREIREREGSMKTTDEMFQLIITYMPYQKGDEEIILHE